MPWFLHPFLLFLYHPLSNAEKLFLGKAFSLSFHLEVNFFSLFTVYLMLNWFRLNMITLSPQIHSFTKLYYFWF